MQQRRFGQKVQNWHRPLGHDELAARYRRERQRDVPVAMDDSDAPLPWEDDGVIECCEVCTAEMRGNSPEHFESVRSIGFGAHLSLLLQASELARELADRAAGTAETAATQSQWVADSKALERRLYEHMQALRAGVDDPVALARLLLRHVPSGLDLVAIEREAARQGSPGLARNLCLFAPFWLRSPRSWRPPTAGARAPGSSLVEHLFAAFPIPACLPLEWTSQDAHHQPRAMQWTVLLGQGGSLRRAARSFGWRVHERFQHHFLQSPPGLDVPLACLRATVLARGGNEVDCLRLAQHASQLGDPTEPAADERTETFRREAMHWVVHHREAIDDRQCRQVLDYAVHRHAEGDPNPPWRERSLPHLLAATRRYAENLAGAWRRLPSLAWPAHDLDHEWEVDGVPWTCTELTTSGQLSEESAAMQHCVATYAMHCVNGSSAIVSLRQAGFRVLTIELRPGQLTVAQAKGRRNRNPTSAELGEVERWLLVVRQRRAAR